MATNPQSTAQIAGHPLHPMLVGFPIAFFTGALVTDIISTGSAANGAWWAQASFYLLAAGLVSAVFTALAGVADFLGSDRIRALNDAWYHAGANVIVVVLEAVNWGLRYTGDSSTVTTGGLVLSLVSVALLLFSGWKGGELVFRHRVAVLGDGGKDI